METRLSRRQFERLLVTAPPGALAIAFGGQRVLAQSDGEATPSANGTPVLAPTPACADEDDLEETLPQTEGPFYSPDTPERTSLLEPDMPGTRLLVTGYVYSTDCTPISGALLDFWQADDGGVYDNEGFRLRGHQFTDDDGRFELETIVPGLYPGRTRHIHVKAQAANQSVLTTQLYFPDEPANDADGIFDPALLVELDDADADADNGKVAFFTFVLTQD
ncbi:MAG: dioxygenase [Thermomicrobiales bacterium]